jgi:asparagine synthase (glutamine-hydrolysing)
LGSVDLSITADAVVFDKSELLDRLGCSAVSSYSSADDLILAAYAKWREECPLYLSGEYSFAIWDPQRRVLFCCRDRVASRPFFYWHSGDRFVFASEPELILRTPGVPRKPNLRKIALMASADGNTVLSEESFHAGIYAVMAATRLTVSRDGIRKGSYWSPQVIPSLIPPGEDDAFEALRHLLIKAVDNRICGIDRVGGLLSGGLDSSALTALASRSLAKSNREITTFSHVLPDSKDKKASDEREFIDIFRTWPNVRINYVIPPPEAGPFSAIDDLSRFRRTFFQGSHDYVYETLQQMAQSAGVQLILDGLGGEHGPTAHGRFYMAELVVSGKWLTLRRHLKSAEGASPLRELGGNLLSMLFPRRRQRPFLVLNPGFVRANRTGFRTERPLPNHRRVQADVMRKFLRGRSAAVGYGPIPYSFPFLDKDILEFCLAAPGSMKVNNGFHRLLIRRALDGILPPRIQWRTDKVRFAVDYFVRYNSQLNDAKAWLAKFGPSDPINEIVDLPRLRRLMVPYREGTRGFEAYVQVPLTTYLINFLRQFAEFQR